MVGIAFHRVPTRPNGCTLRRCNAGDILRVCARFVNRKGSGFHVHIPAALEMRSGGGSSGSGIVPRSPRRSRKTASNGRSILAPLELVSVALQFARTVRDFRTVEPFGDPEGLPTWGRPQAGGRSRVFPAVEASGHGVTRWLPRFGPRGTAPPGRLGSSCVARASCGADSTRGPLLNASEYFEQFRALQLLNIDPGAFRFRSAPSRSRFRSVSRPIPAR